MPHVVVIVDVTDWTNKMLFMYVMVRWFHIRMSRMNYSTTHVLTHQNSQISMWSVNVGTNVNAYSPKHKLMMLLCEGERPRCHRWEETVGGQSWLDFNTTTIKGTFWWSRKTVLPAWNIKVCRVYKTHCTRYQHKSYGTLETTGELTLILQSTSCHQHYANHKCTRSNPHKIIWR